MARITNLPQEGNHPPLSQSPSPMLMTPYNVNNHFDTMIAKYTFKNKIEGESKKCAPREI